MLAGGDLSPAKAAIRLRRAFWFAFWRGKECEAGFERERARKRGGESGRKKRNRIKVQTSSSKAREPSYKLVIQTGKLQPVLIWREKPVLLALLSNLTIPVPASYPVFLTKWREIS